MKSLKRFLPLTGALVLAAILKMWLTITEAVPFNGDEAVVSLMAKHILTGERPIFFYGQAYMGSLDAWLIAGGFALLGEQVWVVRLVQGILYLIYLVSLWLLARELFEDELIPNLAVLLAAIPPVVVTTYTTATLGGYNESLILGNLILWLGYKVNFSDEEEKWWAWLALGFTGGLAFWVLGIAGVYLLPVGLIGMWKFRRQLIPYYGLAAAGFLAGSAPWWLYNLTNSWAALAALSGPRLVETNIFERLLSFSLLGVPALLGLRAPWTPTFFAIPLLILGLLVYTATLLHFRHRLRSKTLALKSDARVLLSAFVVSFLFVFLGTAFGIDATGRYLLPLYLVVVFLTASFAATVWRRRAIYGIILITSVVLLNGATTWMAASSADRITTQFDPITSFDNEHDQALIQFLREENLLRGYANYWVTFRLAFLSDEEIIFAADLPYKQDMSYNPVDNRYQPYSAQADASAEVAYITTKHPELDAFLRASFERRNVSFSEQQIGPYHIFYGLSQAVRPEETGFGEAGR